ncbi:MAG: hypothetical protein GXP41_05435 [Chloroflexi bacterium]|nr:hypothetical protein [Chloroflexota bacterium]
MITQRTVVLVGNSLIIAGLEASLRQQPHLIVQRIQATPPEGEGFWNGIEPDVIIIDLVALSAEETLALLRDRPGLPLVGLDASDKSATLLFSHRQTTATACELVRMIQNLVKYAECPAPDSVRPAH